MTETKYKKILVAGDAMLDEYHFGNVDRISPEAPVPVFLKTGRYRHVPGGAANVAMNLAAIGIDTEFFSVVGNDENGKKLLELLRKQNVMVDKVVISENRPTTSKIRFIGQNNQQVLRVDEEAASDVLIKSVVSCITRIEEHISEYSLVLISDYKKGFLTDEITQYLIRISNESHIPVLVDVKDKNYQKYRGATLLKPNRRELVELSGCRADNMENAVEAAVTLCRQAEASYVLATLGADGMILVNQSQFLRETKSTSSEVYDVTGAGDTSIAYLAAGIVMGYSIEEAMVMSNYAAGVQVSKAGTSVVYPEEVERAMSVTGIFTDADDTAARGSNMYQSNSSHKRLDFYQENGLRELNELRKQGIKIVFTNGCFDILHAGHISYLQEAKKLGDILVVGVNSDESVRRLKGNERPINSLNDRLEVLAALSCVDYVIPFKEDTPTELIETVLPDVLVKGGDYNPAEIAGADVVKKSGGKVVVLPFVEGKSTTSIVEKLKEHRN